MKKRVFYAGFTDGVLCFFTKGIRPYNEYAYIFRTKKDAKRVFDDVRKITVEEVKRRKP